METLLLDYFQSLVRDYCGLDYAEYRLRIDQPGERARFNCWNLVAPYRELHEVWLSLRQSLIVLDDQALTPEEQEAALELLQYGLYEGLTQVESGAYRQPKRQLDARLITSIPNYKVRQLCLELNSTPDKNVLALAYLIAEILKWTLWYRAKQKGSPWREQDHFSLLLEETIRKRYFKRNATVRFLKQFEQNLLKTGHDLARHSAEFIPELVVLNPEIVAIEQLLRECFEDSEELEYVRFSY